MPLTLPSRLFSRKWRRPSERGSSVVVVPTADGQHVRLEWKPCTAVSTVDVRTVQVARRPQGAMDCNRLMARLRHLFNWSIAEGRSTAPHSTGVTGRWSSLIRTGNENAPLGCGRENENAYWNKPPPHLQARRCHGHGRGVCAWGAGLRVPLAPSALEVSPPQNNKTDRHFRRCQPSRSGWIHGSGVPRSRKRWVHRTDAPSMCSVTNPATRT